jgi:hypothetical protein
MEKSELQNSAAGFYIFASDETAPAEGLAGLAGSITVALSKNGGNASAVAPTITQPTGMVPGVYWVAPIAAHRDTLGRIAWSFSAAGAIIAPRLEKIVAVNDQSNAFGALTSLGANAPAGWLNFNAFADGAIGSGKIGANAINSSTIQAATFTATKFENSWLVAAGIAPSALNGKGNWNIGKTGYSLDASYQDALVAAIDAALLNAGDATDLIASIVSRIGNTNVDEAALVAAFKAAIFNAGSIANKLAVDGSGRVSIDASLLATQAAVQAVGDEVGKLPRLPGPIAAGAGFKTTVTDGETVTGGESATLTYTALP